MPNLILIVTISSFIAFLFSILLLVYKTNKSDARDKLMLKAKIEQELLTLYHKQDQKLRQTETEIVTMVKEELSEISKTIDKMDKAAKRQAKKVKDLSDILSEGKDK